MVCLPVVHRSDERASPGSTRFARILAEGVLERFTAPSAVAVDGQGNVFVADRQNNCIRKTAP
jgi:hypothetical protein